MTVELDISYHAREGKRNGHQRGSGVRGWIKVVRLSVGAFSLVMQDRMISKGVLHSVQAGTLKS